MSQTFSSEAQEASSRDRVPLKSKERCTRSTAPVILVASDSATSIAFGRHLVEDTSKIINLGNVMETEGSRGIEEVLARSKDDSVIVCPVDSCLEHPEISALVRDHPLSVQLALPRDDEATKLRCERATRYTVVVDIDDAMGDNKDKAYIHAKAEVLRLVDFARRPKRSRDDLNLDMGKDTFFLSLTFGDFSPHVKLLPELTEGVDALELRVDLLADKNPYSVLRQLSILRRHTGFLPVVFTVRSKCQGGAFPDDPGALFRLLRWGLRAGAEVVDVEANWPIAHREDFIKDARERFPGAVLVGSYHVVGRKTTEDQARALFMECYHGGAVDAVKVRILVITVTSDTPGRTWHACLVCSNLAVAIPYWATC